MQTDNTLPGILIETRDSDGLISSGQVTGSLATTAGKFSVGCLLNHTKLGVAYINSGTTDVPVWTELGAGTSATSYAFQTGAGAIPLTSDIVGLITTDADALTLADGVDGQLLTITMITDGGDGTLTPESPTGYSTITFDDAFDAVQLLFVGGVGWAIIINSGCTIA